MIICLSNINCISKCFIKNKYFCEMGKISDNGGVSMTIITSDMIIAKKTSQLLLMIPIIIYKALFARIRPDRIVHSR